MEEPARTVNLNSAAASHRAGKRRIRSIDTMRGIAMALVIFQHAYSHISSGQLHPYADFAVYFSTRVASVAFMAVSGMMISYFLFTKTDRTAVYMRFAKRALFLLLIGRPIVWLMRYFFYDAKMQDPLYGLLHEYPITDTIAFSLLVAPFIILATSTRARLIVAASILVIARFAIVLIQPQSSALTIVKEIVVGQTTDRAILMIGWPLLPWLAIFILGSYIAKGLADVRSGLLSSVQLARRMRTAAFWLIPIGVLLSVCYWILKAKFGGGWDLRFFQAIYPSRTTTFLPIYLGALLLLFSYLMQWIDVNGSYNRAGWVFSVFGRTSLFTFMTQFLVMHSIPALLGLKGTLNSWQPLILFVVGSSICWCISYSYGRVRGWISADDYVQLSTRAGV
jgi:uncharacterized membrane protein